MSQKEMHEAVRIFLGIFKLEDGNRLQKPAGRSCGALTFSVGRVQHESRGEETR